MINGDELPYRRCVGIALLNQDNKIWIGERTPRKWDNTSNYLWQMPQGGVDKGEDPFEAALRELYEETGITSAELICEVTDWLSYDLPESLFGVALKGRYRGQIQKWYIMRFKGEDGEVDLSPPGHSPEFQTWRWAEVSELPELVIPFKRDVYLQIVHEIGQVIPFKSSGRRLSISALRRFISGIFSRK